MTATAPSTEVVPVEQPSSALAPRPVGQVAVQAAAVAATSLAAGAGVAAVLRAAGRGRRRPGRRAARRLAKRNRSMPIVASRSFLVDVHVLDPRK